jgi:serine protease Do
MDRRWTVCLHPISNYRTTKMFVFALSASIILAAGMCMARGAPESFAPLAERLLPAVVNISTTQTVKREERNDMPSLPQGSPLEEYFKEFFERQQRRNGQEPRQATSLGSGFVIDANGLIVTNNHVIEGADEVTVIFHDDTRLEAKILGKDKKTDLALLKVKSQKPLPYVKFGDSDASKVGDWVVAIGNPFGLGGTVTAGIISARARNINAGPYDDFIQTDASINRGNSGGPMFNLNGEVIGINTAIFSPTGGSVGIGFAIPAKLAKPIILQLKEYGRARRGWLGVRIQEVTKELAESLGLKEPRGALVANVTPDGPAEVSGVKVGDVILEFDNQKISEMRELPRAVAETKVGKPVKLKVLRQGKQRTISVKLGEFPEDEKLAAAEKNTQKNSAERASVLGMELAKINETLRQKFKLKENIEGVLVVSVAERSPSSEQGLRPGDIIRKVGRAQKSPQTGADVRRQVDQALKAGEKTLLLLVERAGNSRFLALQIKNKKG